MQLRHALVFTLLAALCTAPALTTEPSPKAETAKAPIVATLDMEKLLKGAKLAQQLEARLKGLQEAIEAQIAPMDQEYQQKRATFESNKDAYSPEQRTLQIQELQKMEKQLQDAQRQGQEAYARQRDALSTQWRQALDPVLDALGKEQGWDLVFVRPGNELLWSSARLDATALVVERMNATFEEAAAKEPQEQPATPAPAQAPTSKKKK